MTNPHASFGSIDTEPTHADLLVAANAAYNQGKYERAAGLFEKAERFDGISDDQRVGIAIRKARCLSKLGRTQDMRIALDEAWDIAHAQQLIGLLHEVEELMGPSRPHR